jgi:hypothetical protein
MEDLTMSWQRRLGVASVAMSLAAWFLAATPALAQTPQEAVKLVPEKAAGFVIVRNLSELSGKIEELARRIGQPLPFSPLEKIKSELGIDKGLNTSGSALLVLLPPTGPDAQPVPLVYVPVTDYQALVRSLNGKSEGEIATVRLHQGAKEMLVAQKGSFAVFTEPGHRDALKESLKAAGASSEALAPIQKRLADNDVTGVMTSQSIKTLAEQARAHLAQGLDPAQVPPQAQFMAAWAKSVDAFLKSAESDISHLVVGSRLDKGGNLDFDAAAVFTKGSSFAQAGAKAQPPKAGQLAGLPDEPFLVAFNGSLSGRLMEEMMNFSMQIMTMMAKDVPAEKVNKLEQIAKEIFKDLRGMSMVMGLGKSDEALFQNSTVIMKVADAQAYLKHYLEYLEAYGDFMKGVTLPEGFPKQTMTATKTQVGGLSALEVNVDMGFGGDQPEIFKKMMQTYFGPGGKMVVTTVALDNNTLLMRYTPPAETKQFLARFKNQPNGLAQNPDVLKTIRLLPPGAQWFVLVSPHGSLAFSNRILEAVPEAAALRLPEFPKTPPVGIAARLSSEAFEGRLAIPAAVIDNLGPFIQQILGKRAAGPAD